MFMPINSGKTICVHAECINILPGTGKCVHVMPLYAEED